LSILGKELALSISRIGFIALALLCAPLQVGATPEEPETQAELVVELEKTYKDITSVKADFEQVQRSVMGEVRQKGQVRIKRPLMARWEFLAPSASVMVTNGATVWVYTPATQQVIETTNIGKGDGVMQLLDDLGKLEDHFEVTRFEQPGEGEGRRYLVELVPKNATNYKRIIVEFTRKQYKLHRVVVVDAMDGEIELTFSHVKYNEDMPDSDFEFQAPENTQVIKGGL
jgi:outer membrane lipoprotein carrier protein